MFGIPHAPGSCDAERAFVDALPACSCDAGKTLGASLRVSVDGVLPPA